MTDYNICCTHDIKRVITLGEYAYEVPKLVADRLDALAAENERLRGLLKDLCWEYKNAIVTGRERIVQHDGDCDSTEKILSGSTYYNAARAAIEKKGA